MNKNNKNKTSIQKDTLDQLLEDENKEFKFDQDHKNLKGDLNKDIRMNPNNNRKEVDVVTSENQLR